VGVGAGQFLDAVNLRDVRMIERRERLRLALETHQAIGVEGKRLRQDLERNITIEPRVAGPVDLAHPASTERRREGVGPEPGSRRQHSSNHPASVMTGNIPAAISVNRERRHPDGQGWPP